MAREYKPDPGVIPSKKFRPEVGAVPSARYWSFSLRYWKQIEYFGLAECQNNWFVSFLERLRELSAVLLDDFLRDYNFKSRVRYHPIDWSAQNVPISKSDIDWLGGQELAEDFELVQFHVSKALGRVVGFFDPLQVFQIVLLDPMHNLQPSKYNDYKITATSIAECEISRLIVTMQDLVVQSEVMSEDDKKEFLAKINTKSEYITGGALLLKVTPERLGKIHALSATGVVTSLGELVELAVDEIK